MFKNCVSQSGAKIFYKKLLLSSPLFRLTAPKCTPSRVRFTNFLSKALKIVVSSSCFYIVLSWSRASYQSLMILTRRNNLISNYRDIFRLKVIKILRIWLKSLLNYTPDLFCVRYDLHEQSGEKEDRSQFHQYFTSGFFVRKFCAKLFVLRFKYHLEKEYRRKWAHKMLVKLIISAHLRQYSCANKKFNLYCKHKKTLRKTFARKSHS